MKRFKESNIEQKLSASQQKGIEKISKFDESKKEIVKPPLLGIRYGVQGSENAQCDYGVCYIHGLDGVEQNFKKAVNFFNVAANQGDARAQNYLGVCYQYGIGVEVDEKAAANLYQSAAAQELPSAQINFSECLITNCTRIKRSLGRALKFMSSAAEIGDPEAQFQLAGFYESGGVVEQDYKTGSVFVSAGSCQGSSECPIDHGGAPMNRGSV